MGGWGSGKYGLFGNKIAKTAVEDCLCIDIRRWQREKLLTRPFLWAWWNGEGKQQASISVYPNSEYILIKYRVNGEPVGLQTWLDETPTNYGTRTWFLCPGCKRRVACLYNKNLHPLFKCRKCHNLNYRSSQISGDIITTNYRKLKKVLQRLGEEEFKPYLPPPIKPKNMHLKTYRRLEEECETLLMERELAFDDKYIKLLKRIQPL
ncbi:hypothetical protein [Heyndrickxia sporothermodurans]|uniref:Uncharacterized protein n=1 Tax=Heyndrickxia sporothermodurans TaxID=46224 RepID=A0A150LFP1_9BACI|nr:hypothetical protein [Heyndrickxia sporothermodurans]KYD11050.1 hypothetical protein B4102_0110 [Heyndrickxia sporothermodurans]MED3649607.1 hypothetical protein [Heyndrickxia sporothermodurans]MED3699897.1 hypothetical protein [Heyndrickxia sporothermodurans]